MYFGKQNVDNDPYLGHLMSERKARASLSHKTEETIDTLLKELSHPLINLHKLRTLCFSGIPDEINGLRALIWKLLFGYLPNNRSKWEASLENNRKLYAEFVEEFLSLKKEKLPLTVLKEVEKMQEEPSIMKESNGEEVKHNEVQSYAKCIGVISMGEEKEHPLSKDTGSDWYNYYKDFNLWEEVEKDTKRTRSELDLFSQPTSKPLNKCLSRILTRSEPELHSDVLSRILFIYGKLNPGVRYVQGMNELLAPIYYCFYHDNNPAFKGYAEPDAFYCFSTLMGETKENFVKSLDNTDAGIKSRITDLNNLLKRIDQPLWTHLNNEHVHPQFYTLRWLMLLLTQEFELMDVLRLWDTLLSHPHKMDFLNYCCIALIENIRDKIIGEEFPVIMENLQKNVTAEGVETMLKKAIALYKQYANPEEMSYIVFLC